MANEIKKESGNIPQPNSKPIQYPQPERINEGKTSGRPAPSRK